MSETLEEIQPVVEIAPEPEPVPELVYRYQPTDDSGRKLGGEQVIKYKTHEELAEKLAHQNTLLVRKLRDETRKNRLGQLENVEISEDAPRYVDPVEFKPRDLTNEERFELSRDLLDPEKAIEAQSRLFEASVGISPERMRNALSEVSNATRLIQVQQEVDAFMAGNPDYVPCAENRDAIMQWLMRYDLAPVRQNMQRAYDFMKSQDPPLVVTRESLVTSTVVQPPAPVAAPMDSPPALPEAERPSLAPVPTGFSRADSGYHGTPPDPGSDITYTLTVNGQQRVFKGMAAINAMPSDEYARRIRSDPTFQKKVQALDDEQARRHRG